MTDANRIEGGCRCTEILTSILEEHEDVYVSLACTGRLLAHGSLAVVQEVASVVESWKKNPNEVAGLIDLLPVNAFVALARAEPWQVFTKVERQMSISALITAHAFFETILKDLLRVTLLCDREHWLKEMAGKSITFESVSAKGIESCADELFEKELGKLGLAGMPALLGKLLGFCKGNVTTKSHFQNYVLDTERLRALDTQRHNYAHRRTKAPYSIKQAEEDLRYLTITAVHLVTCIMAAFGLKGQHRGQPSD